MKNPWVPALRNLAIFAVLYCLAALGYALVMTRPEVSYFTAWSFLVSHFFVLGALVGGAVVLGSLFWYASKIPVGSGDYSSDTSSSDENFGPSISQHGLPMSNNLDTNGNPYGFD